jgi:hypothetical protein
VVLDEDGKVLMSNVLQTKVEFIRSFLQSLNGSVELVFEEGALAQWMFEITKPLVERVVVCNPRTTSDKGKKNDKLDARKLADLLRLGAINGVYHHQRRSFSEVKQLVCIYDQLTQDRIRIINRFKSVFREQALQITIASEDLLDNLKLLPTESHRIRAKLLFAELEAVSKLRDEARLKMVEQSRKHKEYKLLQTTPGVSEIRAAQLLAWVVTPHRLRTKRQFWSYCGLSVITRSSSDYRVEKGSLIKSKKNEATYGLTKEYHRGLKNLFKSAALDGLRNKQIKQVYEKLVNRGLKESVARVQIARKIAAGCLAVWKSGEEFEVERLVSG